MNPLWTHRDFGLGSGSGIGVVIGNLNFGTKSRSEKLTIACLHQVLVQIRHQIPGYISKLGPKLEYQETP